MQDIVPDVTCDGNNNATPPSPAIAPAIGSVPAAADIDPRCAAQALAEQFGPGGIDPRIPALVPGFDAPFYQAGLAGYSDAAMRIVARRQGCPYCVTEALLDITLLGGGKGFTKADLADLADNVPGGDEDRPLAGQIMGSDPAEMAAAAVKMIEQGRRKAKEYRKMGRRESDEATKPRRHGDMKPRSHGVDCRRPSSSVSVAPWLRDYVASSFSAIDVNLACPVKKIARKARGGHWLSEPAGAIRILEAVREAVPTEIPVTVKMRRAFDDSEEMRDNFYRIFDAAYDIGCAWVTVHARTVRQKYIGPSRWDLLREIVQRDHPGRIKSRIILGSGDIWSAGDVFRMIAYCSAPPVGRASSPSFSAPSPSVPSPSAPNPSFPTLSPPSLTGVSIARGCIGNPWIFRQCRDLLAGREPSVPTIAEQRTVLEQHFDLALAVNERMVRGDAKARRARAERITGKTMRKFGIQFSKHHPKAEAVRKRFIAISTVEDWRAVLDEFYQDEGENS